MRCRKPRTVGFQPDGKTIAWSQKTYSKEYPTFQLPCGKCLACRLEYGRQWAVRAVHESKIHDQNCFITLTYNDESLESDKLIYEHFQSFMQKLRDSLRADLDGRAPEIGYMAVGEYGEKRKRPHFHACLFGYRPIDSTYKYTSDRGDRVYESKSLTDLWDKGICEFGDVSFQSASYVARYATKKLVHGKDQDHGYQPIFKTSRKYAIGKRWLEKFWPDVFNHGHVILKQPDGTSVKCGIPRYYEKWLREHHIDQYVRYLSDVKYPKMTLATDKSLNETLTHINNNWDNPLALSRNETEHRVLKQKINNQLEKYRKL